MPPKQLYYEEPVSRGYDPTGENAKECGAAALACVDCSGPAGCAEHAQRCSKCGEPVCVYCEDEHTCIADQREHAA